MESKGCLQIAEHNKSEEQKKRNSKSKQNHQSGSTARD